MPARKIAVPAGLGILAEQIAAGQRPPAQPRDAATVILLRPGAAGLEVLMLARARAMDFAPGAHVFPGGSLDPQDASVPWQGPAPHGLGVPDERARALACAAIRETFEESGVLLAVAAQAQPPARDLIRDAAQQLAQDRQDLLAGAVSFADVLTRHGLTLRADLLTPWTRWITPEAADRRFDTWFFVAAMPAGQAADASAESDSIDWLRPADALDGARAGRLTLLPPTAVALAEVGGYPDLPAVLAAPRAITPLMPVIQVQDGAAWLSLPPGVEYPL